MDLEEEIEKAFEQWWTAPDLDNGVDISEYMIPVVKRAQAEAWSKGFRAGWWSPSASRHPATSGKRWSIWSMMRLSRGREKGECHRTSSRIESSPPAALRAALQGGEGQ